MDYVPGPFKSNKASDNKQRRTLPKQPLQRKGQNEQEAEHITKIEAILKSSDSVLAQFKKSGLQPQLVSEKKTRNKQRKEQVHSGGGYVYTYDADGKPIPLSRILMEKRLGRPLHQFEVVVYIDGDRRNCVDENLAIGFRQNAPISRLQCTHCGTVGEITLLQHNVSQEGPDC